MDTEFGSFRAKLGTQELALTILFIVAGRAQSLLGFPQREVRRLEGIARLDSLTLRRLNLSQEFRQLALTVEDLLGLPSQRGHDFGGCAVFSFGE
ncbi:MAG: hypothetical protein WDO74_04935 [Pseudomonadota bacterium]